MAKDNFNQSFKYKICDTYPKMIVIRRYIDSMIDEFKEQVEESPHNFVAAFGLDIYKDIKKTINSL